MNSEIYNVAGADSLPSRISLRIRRKIFYQLCRLVDLHQQQTVLDVGVTTDKSHRESNYFEAWFPYKKRITAHSNQDAVWLEHDYPGLRFVHSDGREMPFPDASFDLVFSSAVLEHVGSFENQENFLRECCRVSRHHVFLTTPNRWHPLELHTALPLLHWLPKPTHRRLLKIFGLSALAKEETLNLLDAQTLRTMCHNIGIADFKIFRVFFLGFPSNLLLYINIAKNNRIRFEKKLNLGK
ncbi:MAG TPA: SAM-dependent methyltransferase [Desulfobulbaceae bacterium]|nr:SAM-dependent methyltransferase [Desulfobulbaceae bacterium]